MPFKKEKKKTSMTMEQVTESLNKELELGKKDRRVQQYVHKKRTIDELKNNTTGMKSKIKITGIRKAIEDSEGYTADSPQFVYGKTDKLMTGETEQSRTTTLHGSLGRELREEKKEYVFELSIAGSGFTEFRKLHHHSHGKTAFFGNPVTMDKTTLFDKEHAKKGYFKPTEEFTNKTEALMTKLYGKQVDPKGKTMSKYIRKKVENGITKVSLPGPEGMDSGDKQRSMESLRGYALDFAKEYLTGVFEEFNGHPEKVRNVNLLLKGHSRGGVSIGEGMQMIQSWVHNHPTYRKYENYVKYDLMQFDPVPGWGNMVDHKELNLDAEKVADPLHSAKRANDAPRENVSSTVFYSMNVAEDFAHKHFFDPLPVIGAKRVVLCPMGHTLHLSSVDNTQKTAGEKDSRLSKVGFTFAGNGEVYRGSGINKLEEGVFVMDENATMVKIKSPKQLEAILSNALGKPSHAQKERRDTLQNVANKWFESHPMPVKDRMAIANRGMRPLMDRVAAIGKTDSKDPAEKKAAMESSLYKAGEAAIEGRMMLTQLVTKDKLSDADRKLAGECISKMVLFEIASRSPNAGNIADNFGKLTKELAKAEEIKAFTDGCTTQDIVGFFDRAGEKAFCRNLQLQNKRLQKQKTAEPAEVKAVSAGKKAAKAVPQTAPRNV